MTDEECREEAEFREDQDGYLELIPEEFRANIREFARTANEHLQNIYGEGELAAGATIRKFRMVRIWGEGHSNGYASVLDYTSTLVGILVGPIREYTERLKRADPPTPPPAGKPRRRT